MIHGVFRWMIFSCIVCFSMLWRWVQQKIVIQIWTLRRICVLYLQMHAAFRWYSLGFRVCDTLSMCLCASPATRTLWNNTPKKVLSSWRNRGVVRTQNSVFRILLAGLVNCHFVNLITMFAVNEIGHARLIRLVYSKSAAKSCEKVILGVLKGSILLRLCQVSSTPM